MKRSWLARRLLPALVAGALVLGVGPDARADDTADEAELQFQIGVEKYRGNDFRAALEHFLASNRLAPNRNVMLNIAKSYEQLNQYAEAYRYYTLILDSETDPGMRDRVAEYVQRITPKVAVLQIVTEPSGAIIYLNRKDLGARGNAPRNLGLNAGKYRIIAELPGYEPASTGLIDAQIGTITPISLKLQKVLGSVRFEGIEGVAVRTDSENGPVACTIPCEAKLPPGKQTLFLTKEGYQTLEQPVDVAGKETITVRPKMIALTGSVLVTSDVKEAIVSIDGKAVGVAPTLVTLPVGAHRVSIAQTGYVPVERDIVVRHDVQDRVALSLSEQSNELLNATTVTASRSLERVEDAPGSVTVITRQQILDMNARTLREVLNVFVPGMDVVPTYFRFGDRVNEGIYSRGLLSDFSSQVLILHNGQAKYNETTFSSAFTAIEFTLDNVERVEVSRSPIPLYGGSAITVINIVTREQYLNGVEANASMVTGDRDGPLQGGIRGKNFSATFGRDIGRWHLGGSVQFYDDNGQYHDKAAIRGGTADLQAANTLTTADPAGGPSTVSFLEAGRRSLRDGTKNGANATVNIRSKDQKYSAELAFKKVDKDAFFSSLLPSQSNDLYTYRSHVVLGALKYRPIDEVEFTVGGMQTKWTNIVNFGGVPFGGDESNYHAFVDGAYRKSLDLIKGRQNILAGVRFEGEGQYDASLLTWTDQSNWSRDRNDAKTFAPNDDRQVLGVYAEDNWKILDNLSLLFGGRFDFYNGFGTKVAGGRLRSAVFNPRIAATYSPAKVLLLKALYASAARPPSIYERTGVNLPPLAGSRATGNERIDTVEVSAAFKLDRFKFQATPFVQFYSDRIEFTQLDAAQPTLTAGNTGSTFVRGIDGDARFFFNPRNYLFANASYILSEDTRDDSRTLFLPSTYLNGGVNVNFANLNINVTQYFRGPRRVPTDATTGQPYVSQEFSGSTFWANLSVGYNVTPNLRPYLTIENITNTRNYVPLASPGLAIPLRSQSFWLGLQYALN